MCHQLFNNSSNIILLLCRLALVIRICCRRRGRHHLSQDRGEEPGDVGQEDHRGVQIVRRPRAPTWCCRTQEQQSGGTGDPDDLSHQGQHQLQPPLRRQPAQGQGRLPLIGGRGQADQQSDVPDQADESHEGCDASGGWPPATASHNATALISIVPGVSAQDRSGCVVTPATIVGSGTAPSAPSTRSPSPPSRRSLSLL